MNVLVNWIIKTVSLRAATPLLLLLLLLPVVLGSLSLSSPGFFISMSSLQNNESNGSPIKFTVIPPSPNPSSKLNRATCKDLREKLGAPHVECLSGRLWFCASADSSPPLDTWGSLLRTGVRSVRVICFDSNVTATSTEAVVQEILQTTDFAESIRVWELFGNELKSDGPSKIHIGCRLLADAALDCSNSSKEWSRQLAVSYCLANDNWIPTMKRKDADLEMHLLLHQGNRVTLELIALVPSQVVGELPSPGFKRVESWAVAKSADIQDGNLVVLDPMCGRATFLVEAATFWPNARYVGIDKSASQLHDALVNVQSAQVNVQLLEGDSTQITNLKEQSVDRIMCCPPFGKQFGVQESNKELYENMLYEWSRLLKDESGKMVLVIDSENFDILIAALWTNGLVVDAQRDFRLGKLTATIIVASKGTGEQQQTTLPPGQKLPWELDIPAEFQHLRGRGLWARLRANALPALIPASKIQKKTQ